MIIRLRNEQQKETARAKQQVQNQQNTSVSTTTATTTASSIQTTSTKQSSSLPVQMTEQTTSDEQKDPYDCSTEEEDSDHGDDVIKNVGISSSVIKADTKNDCNDVANKGKFSMYIPRILSYFLSIALLQIEFVHSLSLLSFIANNIYLS